MSITCRLYTDSRRFCLLNEISEEISSVIKESEWTKDDSVAGHQWILDM